MLITNSGGLTDYQITLKDPTGVTLAFLDSFASLQFSRTVNNIGALTITLPFDERVPYGDNLYNKFLIDGRIEIQRSVQGGQLMLEGETFYLIRRKQRVLNEQGQYVMVISAVDTMDLLRRRTVTPDPTSTKATKTAVAADDMLKVIFAENFLAGAGAGRDLSAYMQVQPNFTAAPQQTKQFQGRNVLTVMQEICAAAAADATTPTYLAFDLVWTGTMLEFRTYTGQRGADRRASSGNPIVVGVDFGNMSASEADQDHSGEATFVYAGLNGTASDSARMGISPFGRIEKYYAAQGNSTTEQNNEAAGQLRLSRPRYIHAGTLVQTDGFRYGLHYGYGDYMTTQFAWFSSDCRLDGISIGVANGLETVGGAFRSEAS